MKGTFFAVSTLSVASLASARTINKARNAAEVTATSAVGEPVMVTATSAVGEPVATSATPRNGFELDVTTSKLGLKDYYSREDNYIFVNIGEDDALLTTTVRSVKNDVTCTVKDIYGYQVRKFGGEHPDSIDFTEFEGEHAYTIGCYFDGEEGDLTTYDVPASKSSEKIARQESGRNGFEVDITYAQAGLKDFYSREDGFISETFLAGDEVTQATVRSVNKDVTCTIKDINGFQVRKLGGEHPETIELSEYESKMARSIGCFFNGEEPQ